MSELASLIIVAIFWLLVSLFGKRTKNTQNNKAAGRAGKPARPGAPSEPQRPAPHAESARPALRSDAYQGSLGYVSAEGVDPCHDDPETLRPGSLQVSVPEGTDPCHDGFRPVSVQSGREAEPSAPPLNLSWTGSDVVKGFVYGEILNRKRA